MFGWVGVLLVCVCVLNFFFIIVDCNGDCFVGSCWEWCGRYWLFFCCNWVGCGLVWCWVRFGWFWYLGLGYRCFLVGDFVGVCVLFCERGCFCFWSDCRLWVLIFWFWLWLCLCWCLWMYCVWIDFWWFWGWWYVFLYFLDGLGFGILWVRWNLLEYFYRKLYYFYYMGWFNYF